MVTDMPDFHALFKRARTGDEVAEGQLFERYRSYLRILAQRQITGALARRLDPFAVVQQTLLEGHRDFRCFAGTSEPELAAWLACILAHNVAETIRFHVSTAKRAPGREQAAGAGIDATAVWHEAVEQSFPSQRSMRGELAMRLARAMECLSETQHAAIRLRHLEGWPLVKIATELEISLPAAAGLIKRGMRSLRNNLGPDS